MHFLAHRPGARLLAALAPLLALCACATQRPEARQWRTLRAEGFTVYHAAGLGRDGRYVERLAADAFARLTETFGGNTKTSLGTLAIYVHAQPTADADVGRAMLRTARRSSALEAELHLLAPSLHPPDTATVVGLRFDDAYFAKLLTHEISTLFLETVTEEKSSGWTLYDAPSWFVQGYEEYLGLTLASVDTARIWKRYRQWAVAASPPLDIAAGARNDTDIRHESLR